MESIVASLTYIGIPSDQYSLVLVQKGFGYSERVCILLTLNHSLMVLESSPLFAPI